jgi:hypothetical protein
MRRREVLFASAIDHRTWLLGSTRAGRALVSKLRLGYDHVKQRFNDERDEKRRAWEYDDKSRTDLARISRGTKSPTAAATRSSARCGNLLERSSSRSRPGMFEDRGDRPDVRGRGRQAEPQRSKDVISAGDTGPRKEREDATATFGETAPRAARGPAPPSARNVRPRQGT